MIEMSLPTIRCGAADSGGSGGGGGMVRELMLRYFPVFEFHRNNWLCRLFHLFVSNQYTLTNRLRWLVEAPRKLEPSRHTG